MLRRLREGFDDPSQATYFNGARAAIVAVSKTASQDALLVKAALDLEVAQAQADAPDDITLSLSADSTTSILERLRIIGWNGVQGLILGTGGDVAVFRPAYVVLGGDGPAGILPWCDLCDAAFGIYGQHDDHGGLAGGDRAC